ncbi:MAG: DHH family phosphoesterase [Oscillospiraceae bacterium]|nr:DHH family phosphoesterase [Oscillospiraceae bacterium]
MADVRDLVALCKGKRVFIQTHNFPDPDAIGAAFGLKKLLEHYGVSSTLCYDGRIDKLSTSRMLETLGIQMLSGHELSGVLRESDCIICVDSQKYGGNITDFAGEEIAAIDHHPTYVEVEYRYADIRQVGACSTIIAEYFMDCDLTPDAATATALLYGLKMDTLNFTRGVTMEDIKAFSFLLPLSDVETTAQLENNQLEFRDLRAYGAAIENIKVEGFTGFSRIPFSCPNAMIAILSDFILSLVEVEVAVIYCAREDGLKFSVRSERKDIDAGKLTRLALDGIGDGGGHATMAGGQIPVTKLAQLGADQDGTIRERFMQAIGHLRGNA